MRAPVTVLSAENASQCRQKALQPCLRFLQPAEGPAFAVGLLLRFFCQSGPFPRFLLVKSFLLREGLVQLLAQGLQL